MDNLFLIFVQPCLAHRQNIVLSNKQQKKLYLQSENRTNTKGGGNSFGLYFGPKLKRWLVNQKHDQRN
jgi:hypothetical protein